MMTLTKIKELGEFGGLTYLEILAIIHGTLSQIGQSRVSTYERYKVVRIIFKKNGFFQREILFKNDLEVVNV